MSANLNVSDFKLEKYLTGDLPAEEMKELRLRENTDEIFHARVQALREENAKILAANPFSGLEARMNDSADGEERGGRMLPLSVLLRVAAVMVVALGIFTAVFVFDSERNLNVKVAEGQGSEVAMVMESAEGYGETRVKGMETRLEVWKKTGDSAVQMVNLGNAREGDELQLRYSVPEKCYGLLFSMDGNGVLTVHMGNGSGSVALESGKMVTLPFAYKLDNAPHFEKFFLLTSRKTFAIDENDIDAILKEEGIKVVEFTVSKVSE
ncbi:MAG: hypothetical protein MJY98_05450 [Fibrobacter sp.]|nr:hypothetical protein [Fibrobacter sp.]